MSGEHVCFLLRCESLLEIRFERQRDDAYVTMHRKSPLGEIIGRWTSGRGAEIATRDGRACDKLDGKIGSLNSQ